MYRRQLEKAQVDGILEGLGLRGDERAELLDPATLIRISNSLVEFIRVTAPEGAGELAGEEFPDEAEEE
jgi:hypothetical protein